MLKDTFEFYELFVNERTGIIKEIKELKFNPFSIKIYVYSAIMPVGSDDSNPLSVSAAGKSPLDGLSRCLGEAIERYCGYWGYRWKKLFYGTYRELIAKKKKAVHPEEFRLFSEEQYQEKGFPFQRFTVDTSIFWVKGKNLLDCKEYYLPAQLCFLSKLPSEKVMIGYSTSTGLACGRSYEEAVIKAIYEVIERDAFTIMWLNKLNFPVLEPEFVSNCWLSETLEILNSSHYKRIIYLLENATGFFTCFTMLLNTKLKSPLVSVGTASNLNLYKAVEKSVLEAFHGLWFLFECDRNNIKIRFRKGKPLIKNFKDHALLYASPQRIKMLSFLLKSKRKIKKVLREGTDSYSKIEELKEIISKFKNIHYPIFVIDLTPEFLKHWDFYIVKVIIPGFVDLPLGDYSFRGLERIYEIPFKLGFDRKKEELNKDYHPFP